MSDVNVRRIAPPDFPAVLRTLVRAFDDDPWFNFIAAQDDRRLERIEAWLRRGLVRRSFPFGETYTTTDFSGAALWIPPHSTHDGPLDEIEVRLALLRIAGWRRAGEVREAMRLIDAGHSDAPSMELRVIGVDPAMQGRGIGRALIQPMLDRCDLGRLTISLMCTKERNVAFYRRFGFDVTSEVQLPNGPRLWHMRRAPGA
jgi:ribosomal protein S18 acetylase RimI-like enzyme